VDAQGTQKRPQVAVLGDLNGAGKSSSADPILRLAEQTTLPATEPIDHAKIDAALDTSFREMLLEHARMGRSVSEWRDGKVVTVTPVEIFARYGLDETGRPKPEPKEEVPV